MKWQLRQLGEYKEWIGLGAGVMLAGALYFTLIHPSLRLSASHERTQEGRNAAIEELENARTSLDHLHQQIADKAQALKDLGGSPPLSHERDMQVARITHLAKDYHIAIDQYSPIDTIVRDEYEAFFVQFTARGSFPAIREYLQRIEEDVDFVDITHFSLTTNTRLRLADELSNPTCVISWSCQINGMRTGQASSHVSTHASIPSRPLLEVAIHEP